MLILPTFDDSSAYEYLIGLEGRDYRLRYTYSERVDAWHLDVELADGTALATGVRLVANLPLLRRYIDDRLPPGVLVALAMADPPADPGRDDLGEQVVMVYIASDELPQAESIDDNLTIAIQGSQNAV